MYDFIIPISKFAGMGLAIEKFGSITNSIYLWGIIPEI